MTETRNLRVLMVAPRYFPFMGGVQTHVHEVGRRLAADGVDVTLLTTVTRDAGADLPGEEMVEGMCVIRVLAWPPGRDYYIAPRIAAIVKQGAWDVVHCQGCNTFVPPIAMRAAREAGIPYVVTFHTGGHSSAWRNKIRGMQWRMQRPLLAHATKLIGVSQFEAQYFCDLLDLPEQQFVVIPNGATLPDRKASGEIMLNSGALIASVGRLERYKGHQRLIRALPRICMHRPDARLVIIGKGPYENRLRSLAEKMGVNARVEFRSFAADDRRGMARQLSQAALVALLSEYEAHPIAIMEALALRRPVLVADTSGLREIAEQGFARAVSLKSTDDEIARAALQQIEEPLVTPEHFELPTWEDCVRRLEAVYSAAVGRTTALASRP